MTRTLWDQCPTAVARALFLRDRGMTSKEVAAVLTSESGIRVSKAAVESKLRRVKEEKAEVRTMAHDWLTYQQHTDRYNDPIRPVTLRRLSIQQEMAP